MGQRGARVLAATLFLLCGSPAGARFVPLQTTPRGLADRVDEVAGWATEIGPSIGIEGHLSGLAGCRSLEREVAEGDEAAMSACLEVLGRIYGALVDAEDDDPRRRAVRWYVAWGIVDAALRVNAARAAVRAGNPGALVPAGAVPAQVLVHEDYRTLRIRPLRALRPGRTYALQIAGMTPEERAAVRRTVVPKPGADGLEITPGSLVEAVVAGMRDDPSDMDHETAIALARQIERDLANQDGTSPVAGVQLRLPHRLEAKDLERLVPTFVPEAHTAEDDVVVALPVADLRGSLRPMIERLGSLPCARPAQGAREEIVQGMRSPDAVVVQGEYPSLEIRAASGERIREVSVEEARRSEVPYLLAVPPDAGPDTSLVIAVHGHGGNALQFFTDHAEGIVSRGMAMLAIELPEHGDRGAREREFLGVLDPTRLRVNYRQSLVDILAAVRVVEDCGLPLPDGVVFQPREVRYLGYSFGGLLGVSLRALAPTLGRTVLVAAAGDLAGWLMLHFPNYLESPILTCLGGDQQGRECLADRACGGGGICWIDPFFGRIAFLFHLPFGLVLADAEPLGPARLRTGSVAKSPVLLLTAGEDGVLFSRLQAELGAAYDMHGEPPGVVRGPRSERIHWAGLEHDLIANDEVRARAYDFLAAEPIERASEMTNQVVDKP